MRWTRSGQSWASLGAAFAYVYAKAAPSVKILMILLALPSAYAGLRQIGHWAEVVSAKKAAK